MKEGRKHHLTPSRPSSAHVVSSFQLGTKFNCFCSQKDSSLKFNKKANRIPYEGKKSGSNDNFCVCGQARTNEYDSLMSWGRIHLQCHKSWRKSRSVALMDSISHYFLPLQEMILIRSQTKEALRFKPVCVCV